MRRRSIVGFFCVFLFGCEIAYALPPSHSPFFPQENYRRSLTTCLPVARKIQKTHPPQGVVRFEGKDRVSLVLTMSTLPHKVGEIDSWREHYTGRLERNGELILPESPLPLVGDVAFLLPEKAICHDLNDDGAVDFITNHSRHGNAFGAAFYDRLVILSTSSGSYRFWAASTMFPSSEDYVAFGKLEPLVMVTTSYAKSVGANPHSYYVYDLWAFRDGEIVSANHVDNRFPKWVWMTYSENHNPAISLSAAAKVQLRQTKVFREILAP